MPNELRTLIAAYMAGEDIDLDRLRSELRAQAAQAHVTPGLRPLINKQVEIDASQNPRLRQLIEALKAKPH